MSKDAKNGLQCSEFEAILADALDSEIEAGTGLLTAEAREAFAAHGRSCPVCGPLLADAREGMLLLRAMKDLEPPKNLVHNILAATSRAETSVKATAGEASPGWLKRKLHILRPSLAGLMHSRFATSFAM